MPKFRIPTIPEIAAIQREATAAVVNDLRFEYGVDEVRVQGDGSPEDLSITTVVPANAAEYRVVTTVQPGSSPKVTVVVYVGTYDGSGSHGVWYAKEQDGLWRGEDHWTDFFKD